MLGSRYSDKRVGFGNNNRAQSVSVYSIVILACDNTHNDVDDVVADLKRQVGRCGSCASSGFGGSSLRLLRLLVHINE